MNHVPFNIYHINLCTPLSCCCRSYAHLMWTESAQTIRKNCANLSGIEFQLKVCVHSPDELLRRGVRLWQILFQVYAMDEPHDATVQMSNEHKPSNELKKMPTNSQFETSFADSCPY